MSAYESKDGTYLRQLLSGRDFAVGDPLATQMMNFCYLIGDAVTRSALVVDPAYQVDDVLSALAEDSMTIAGILVTHHHPDHVGGDLAGIPIEGIAQLLEKADVPVHVNREELRWLERSTGVQESYLVPHGDGDKVSVGGLDVELIHTPGHTPGSQCFLARGRLIAGDTLFLEGCGRTDLPGGDAEAMYHSLTQRLSKVPDDAILYPGHRYSAAASASMGETRSRNYVLRPASMEQWMAFLGA